MAQGLCDQLIGAWKSVSYVEEPVDGSEPFHLLGEQPRGIINVRAGRLYCRRNSPDLTGAGLFSGDWLKGTDAEYCVERLRASPTRGRFMSMRTRTL